MWLDMLLYDLTCFRVLRQEMNASSIQIFIYVGRLVNAYLVIKNHVTFLMMS